MEYIYLGMSEKLKDFAEKHRSNNLVISLNIDGLPLFKSTKSSLWPILCKVKDSSANDLVFTAALAIGDKPKDTHFLDKAIDELGSLLVDGVQLSNGITATITLSSVLCDAPAKALVKAVKTFSGYYGCDRCEEKGTYVEGCVRFTKQGANRTDARFREQANEGHHTGTSPFVALTNIDMIKMFPNDYMHSVLLGVMRKLLDLWTRGRKNTKLSTSALLNVNSRLTVLKAHIPREFARKPRSLKELDRYKATEFRLFLLYTGKVALKGILPEPMYANFLDLSAAVTILLSEKLTSQLSDTASRLIQRFVREATSDKLYGVSFYVYNVHSLLHITDDAVNFGCLENCSCFPFENYLQTLKKLVRSGRSPLIQIAKRLHEKDLWQTTDANAGTAISYKSPNNMFVEQSSNGAVCNEVMRLSGANRVVCREYRGSREWFEQPVCSTVLGIYRYNARNYRVVTKLNRSLGCKAMTLKLTRNKLIVQQLLHVDKQ
jgi:hypothetical protein